MKISVIIIFLGFFFVRCDFDKLDFDNFKVRPIDGEHGVILGNVTYTMQDLIEKQEDPELDLQEGEGSLLIFVYKDSIKYESQNDFIDIQDITSSANIDVSVNATPPTTVTGPATVNIAKTFNNFEYNPSNNEELDSIFHSSGQVVVTVTSALTGILNYKIRLNNTIKVDGSPFEVVGTIVNTRTDIDAGTGVSVSSLDGAKTTFPEAENHFDVDFEASLILGDGELLLGTESLSFEIIFVNQAFSAIYGKFGQDTVQVGNTTIDMSFFEESGNEGIFFGNPTITFDFDNTFGIPFGVDFSIVFGDKGIGTPKTFLSGPITEEFPVASPADANNLGIPTKTIIEINKENSNIVNILSKSPSRLVLDVYAVSNPYDVTVSNFQTPDSKFAADIDVEMPMELQLESFKHTGTLSLKRLDVSNLDSAYMRIVTVNELPFSGILELEVQDVNNNPLYTVTDHLVLKAPFINADGLVTDANSILEDVPLGVEGVQALDEGSHLFLSMTLNTPRALNSRDIFVKVLADYKLEIKVSVGSTLDLNL